MSKKGKKKSGGYKPRPVAPSSLQVQVQGMTLTVDGESLNDIELFDMLNQFGGNEATGLMLVPKLIRAFVGDEQYPQVMDRLRGTNGRVGFDAAERFLMELLQAINPNSSRSPSLPDSTASNSQPISNTITTTLPAVS
ncbi:MAG: hypothetical protein FWG47_04990 [Propionibacteriaceae bacterium]|nr:hypothetical protein [Propionibacteriaceae bacterium]